MQRQGLVQRDSFRLPAYRRSDLAILQLRDGPSRGRRGPPQYSGRLLIAIAGGNWRQGRLLSAWPGGTVDHRFSRLCHWKPVDHGAMAEGLRGPHARRALCRRRGSPARLGRRQAPRSTNCCARTACGTRSFSVSRSRRNAQEAFLLRRAPMPIAAMTMRCRGERLPVSRRRPPRPHRRKLTALGTRRSYRGKLTAWIEAHIGDTVEPRQPRSPTPESHLKRHEHARSDGNEEIPYDAPASAVRIVGRNAHHATPPVRTAAESRSPRPMSAGSKGTAT